MVVSEGLRREVKCLRKAVHGVSEIGRFPLPDIFISEAEMADAYQKVTNAFKAYEKKQSDINLARLHDTILLMDMKHNMVGANVALNEVRKAFHETDSFKKIQEDISKVDYEKATISEDDAIRLASLSIGISDPNVTHGIQRFGLDPLMRYAMSPVHEYNGTFGFEGNHVKLVTTNDNTHLERPVVSLEALLGEESHGWWHTHPLQADQERPSIGDVHATKQWAVPLITAFMGKDGQPHVHITSPEGKSHELKLIKK